MVPHGGRQRSVTALATLITILTPVTAELGLTECWHEPCPSTAFVDIGPNAACLHCAAAGVLRAHSSLHPLLLVFNLRICHRLKISTHSASSFWEIKRSQNCDRNCLADWRTSSSSDRSGTFATLAALKYQSFV